ncbi:hypothetical protein M1567_03505 [Candidatus Marsarchaeota archaeon]|jgi:hypothetical protein|nr:hypothetical protein [Candidatus Marsarchaeota archaeon]
MYVDTYREHSISPSKVSTFSAVELLRSDKKAHFASFSVDLVGVVSDRGSGKYHIDMQASGNGDDYCVLCMSSNNSGRFVMEAVKRIIVMNNELSGNTTLSAYASKNPREKASHSVNAPVLYAEMDIDKGAGLNYKLSVLKYFDHLIGRTRSNTTLNIYYLSPFYYRDRNHEPAQITTNIVLSNMEIEKESVKEELERMLRNYDRYSGKDRQANLDSFAEIHTKF